MFGWVMAFVYRVVLIATVMLGFESGGMQRAGARSAGSTRFPPWTDPCLASGLLSRYGNLVAISARATDDVWAVGGRRFQGGCTRALVEHWDGERWSMMSLSGPEARSSVSLGSVSADATNDAWAVGSSPPRTTLVEHWDGHLWRRVALPTGPSMSAVAALAPNDVWVVGGRAVPARSAPSVPTNPGRGQLAPAGAPASLVSMRMYGGSSPELVATMHWDGKRWQNVPVPGPSGPHSSASLDAVVAVAPDDVWAAGSEIVSGAYPAVLVEHWDGRRWRIVPSPEGVSELTALGASSARDMWLAGHLAPVQEGINALLHWDGQAWRVNHLPISPTPAPTPLLTQQAPELTLALVVLSPYDAWAAGLGIAHWNGAEWDMYPIDHYTIANTDLTAIGAAASDDVWAAGSVCSYTFVHWNGRQWHGVVSPNLADPRLRRPPPTPLPGESC